MKTLLQILVFVSLMLISFTHLIKAQNMQISGAGSSEVNGIYVQTGTYWGDSYYKYNTIIKEWHGYLKIIV